MTAGVTVWDTFAEKGDRAIRQGNFSEAESCWFRALRIAEYFGDRDPRLSTSLERLAKVYDMTNRHEESLRLTRQAARLERGHAPVPGHETSAQPAVSNNMFNNSYFGFKIG